MSRKRWMSAVVVVLSFLLFACAGRIDKAAGEWLKTHTGPARVNVTGEWNAGSAMGGGWGGGSFIQEGNDFYGTLGFYNVRGVVSGTTLYMNLLSGRRVYYTAKLEKEGEDQYRGMAVEGAIIGTEDAESATIYPIFLEPLKEGE